MAPSAAIRNRTRKGSSHQNNMSSGSANPAAAPTLAASPGKTVSRNETVSASISMTSTKLALMIRMSCLNCDSRTRTTIMMSDSDAATAGRRNTRSQTKLRRPQLSAKASAGTRSSSVRNRMASAMRCSSTSTPMPKRWRSPASEANRGRLKKVSADGMLRVPRPDWTWLLPAADQGHHSVIIVATQGR